MKEEMKVMTDQRVRKVVAIVLIVIAAVLALGLLGMWVMRSAMAGMIYCKARCRFCSF